MNRWLKITLWVVGSLLGVIFLVLGLALWLLTPERLTPIVNQYASEYLEADVKFEKIDVSIFSDFPHLALSLLDGQVISRALPNERDTLLKFKQLDISINAWDLILRQRANVRAVSLSRARLRALIDTSGHASWDILRPAAPDSDTSSSSFTFNLHRAVIDRGFEIYFFDARDSTTFTAGFEGLSFEGELGDDLSKLRIDQLKSKNIGARGYIPSQGLRFESLAHEIAIEKLPSQKGYHLIFNSQNSLTAHGDT
ncbi:MAG: AsmA family protein, partial [Mucinivorans sp.]